jgi:CheY-like chemotaxis protein/signal transduction histidine kinase
MGLSLRSKMMAIVAAAALALLLLVVAGTLTEREVSRQLATIEERYLPRLELGPQLDVRFDRIRRSLQDAVATQDTQELAGTRVFLTRFLDALAAADSALAPGEAAALRTGMEEYYAVAHDVSRRLIAGEKGEALGDAMALMQTRQARATDVLERVTALDRKGLSAAFSGASRAQVRAATMRLVVSACCLFLVMALSWWLGRNALRSLQGLAAGVERFGRGDFAQLIPVLSKDELGEVAERANQMAASLDRLSKERDRTDWIRNGQAGLAVQLRGDLDPREVASRASRYLARYLEAPAAALYHADGEGSLVLLGQYALDSAGASGGPAPRIGFGEGLVGQAALENQLVVVADLPADYLRVRSGLGEAVPLAIVLLPLTHSGRVTAVLELAMFKPWSDVSSDLLLSVREMLASAIEVARGRAALREALAETQRQADRLAAQEEELRATNEELQVQQEELRQTNDHMAERTRELEGQGRKLEQNNSELSETRRRLEQKALELTSASTYKSQFLANMSHELRTPLNSMLLLSSLLAQNEARNLTDRQVEFCKTINGAGKDLLALITQILDLAKIESGKQEVCIAEVAVAALAEYAERVFGPLAHDKGLVLTVELAADVPATISTDRQRVEQILNNLLGNAIKFTSRGQVTLRIARPAAGARFTRPDLHADRLVVFAVSDTGIGIPPEFEQRIFEPFQQVEAQSDRRYGGTGLGLPIARELAGLLGGELQLETAPGRGSTFLCYLPAGLRAPATLAQPVSNGGAPPAAARPYLLVVEDDPNFALALGAVIEQQGLEYVIAPDGETGLRLAKESKSKPIGIILDIRLPDIDGWKVMDRLGADPDTAAIPVHFLSALEAGERGMAMGAVGYVTKPASPRDLVRVIQSLVPRRGASTCRLLVVEDDPDLSDSLIRRLADEGLAIRAVASARQALGAIESEHFDCMILDLSLPDMDGLELLQLLREREGKEPLPVVVYTGRALSKAEVRRLEDYAEAVIMKEGRSAERLLDEIRLFMRRLEQGLPARRPRPAGPSTSQDLVGRKVMVVDDDMRTVYALSALLRSKGAEVLVADTGRIALSTLAEHPDIELVLMDIMMPEMDGYETIRRIRGDMRLRELPVIALTAKAMKEDREQCLQAGATDYLSKPIDPDELLTLMHRRLPEGAAGGTSAGT